MTFKLSHFAPKMLLKYFALFFVFIVIATGVYVYRVILEVQEKFEKIVFENKKTLHRSVLLEKDSLVMREDFDFFYTYMRAFDQKLELGLEDHFENLNKHEALITKEVNITTFLKNDCKDYLCLQKEIPFSEIPSNLWRGLIGVEDYRFLDHQGVDPYSIARALIIDIKAMGLVQGGSTLTQQLVKNLFLTNEKRFERKVREIIYAIYIEKNLSKEEILSKYFNIVYWGVVGGVKIRGIAMASLAYFDRPLSELSDYEAIILIALLKGPHYYNPVIHRDRLRGRVEALKKRLLSLKLFDPKMKHWSEADWKGFQTKLKKKNSNKLLLSLYRLLSSESKYLNLYELFVFNRAKFKVFKDLSDKTKGSDIALKFLTLDHKCSNIDCAEKFSYYSKYERDKTSAIETESHQVGSILKPLIYNEFIAMGKSLDDKVSTASITLKLKSGNWTPKNSSKKGEDSEISLREAIQKSKNTALIRLAAEVGFEQLEKRLLIYFPKKLLTPLGEYPAQLLGAIELSLADVANAYLSVLKSTCKSKEEYLNGPFYALTKARKTTIKNVSNQYMKNSMIFGKTGTTNKGLDNWYIASDGEQFYVVWFGVESERRNKNLQLYGSTSAYKVFQYFITYRGKQMRDFYCKDFSD